MPPGPLRQLRDERFGALAAVVLGGFGLVVLGLMRLQIANHEAYLKLSEQNRIRLDVIRAPRGAIRDRTGRLLADNAPSFDIVFRPMPAESLRLRNAPIGEGWLRDVAALLEMDTLDVRRRVRDANRNGQTAVLRRSVPFRTLAAIEESRADLPGIDVDVSPLRRYPAGPMAAQLLGYAGQINDVELRKRAEKGYRLGDLIGKTGVERHYEEVLRGQDGAEFVVVNAAGKRVATWNEGPPRLPVPGKDVTLTIDLDVQRALEEAMSGVASGAAVVIDPRDGGVLAMVSRPTFDPNEFSRGISFARWKELNEGGANPLLNRSIQSAYPPGSTFKIVTLLAGLRNALIQAPFHYAVGCNGGYWFGGRRFGCWNKRGHGNLDAIAALQHSCDVYFYQLGLQLGLERLGATARDMGLGEKTGIDLPWETRGLVPDAAWYAKRFKQGAMPRGVLLNLGIGQGELLTTPLQLALMTSIAANGGRPIRPHVVRAIVGQPGAGEATPVEHGVQTDAGNWDAVHLAMRRVIEAGTGGALRNIGISSAGKTGTAQNPHGEDHALFVCYAPADTPKIAMAIVAENSGHGGSVSAPIAAKVLRRVFLADTMATKPGRRVARAAIADSLEVVGD